MTATHRSAEEIGRTPAGPRALPALGATREVPLPEVRSTPSSAGPARARRAPRLGPDGRAAAARPVRRHRGRATATPRSPRCSRRRPAAGTATRTASRSTTSWPPSAPSSGSPSTRNGSRSPARAWPTVSTTMLDVLADVLTAATTPSDEVARERDRLVERIAVASAQPRTIAREALQRKRASATHPITREMPRPDDVTAVTAEQVRALQASTVPGGSMLTLVGDIDPTAAIARVEQALAGWSGAHAAHELSAPPALRTRRPGAGAPARLGAVAAAALRAGGRPDRSALRRAAAGQPGVRRLLLLALDGERARGQGLHLRRALGPEFDPRRRGAGVDTDVASDVTAAALLETRYELGRLAAVPPTADEVESARRYAIGSLLISLDNQGGLAATLAGARRGRARRRLGARAPGAAGGGHRRRGGRRPRCGSSRPPGSPGSSSATPT